MRFFGVVLLIAVGVSVSAGCAHRPPASPADRFLLHKDARRAGKADSPPPASLEETIGKVRQLMAAARPAPRSPSVTLETTDPILASALKVVAESPTAEHLFDAGAAYHRRGL